MTLPIVGSSLAKSNSSLQLYKGESRDIELTLTEEVVQSGEVIEQPLDLSGATIFFAVRKRAGDAVVLISKTSDTTGEIDVNTPDSEGTAVIHIASSDTNFLEADMYVYDVWVELPSGKRYPVVPISEFKIVQPVVVF